VPSSSLTPITTFVDDPAGWLGYLARRLRTSVAARWQPAALVVVGRYRADAAAIDVEDALKGEVAGEPIKLSLPQPEGMDAYPSVVVPGNGDLTLAFLAGIGAEGGRPPLGVPGSVVSAAQPDRLAAELPAARWCAALPADGPARVRALATAVTDQDPQISASALTLIADQRVDAAAAAVEGLAASDDPLRATSAASVLWLLGRQTEAIAAFTATSERVGHDRLLELWQVRPSDSPAEPSILFGPDPESPWSR
jgi:hypothetical protein